MLHGRLRDYMFLTDFNIHVVAIGTHRYIQVETSSSIASVISNPHAVAEGRRPLPFLFENG